MEQHGKWVEEEHAYLMSLKEKHTYNEIAYLMTEKFGKMFTKDGVRNRIRRTNEKQAAQLPNYKEEYKIEPDGSHKSDKLLRMSAEQLKDVDYLLNAHGFNRDSWELVTARNNIWNSYSKQDGVQTLYASKITVKPKVNGLNIDQLIKAIKDMKPVSITHNKVEVKDKRLLEIPVFDPHFGISDYEYYEPTLIKTSNLIHSRRWEEVLLIIGQDNLHNDDFRGRTSKGTPIEKVDMVKAWEDCYKFFGTLIEDAIKQSNSIKVMYSKGNHDEALSWAFVQMLKAKYPQVIFDDSREERKAHIFGQNFIGVTHGDKARKNLHNLFPVEFPNEWSKAKNRELHTGHYHIEDAKDVFGMMVRTLATRNKTDQWHRDNGFVGGHKRFMLFEYSENELESIHYV
jgi:hypothetical protein